MAAIVWLSLDDRAIRAEILLMRFSMSVAMRASKVVATVSSPQVSGVPQPLPSSVASATSRSMRTVSFIADLIFDNGISTVSRAAAWKAVRAVTSDAVGRSARALLDLVIVACWGTVSHSRSHTNRTCTL